MKSRPEKVKAATGATVAASSVKNQDVNQGFNVSNSTEIITNRAITVPFHGAELYVVEHNGQPYTPMKPIVEGMGLAWQPQHRKLATNEARWGITIMVMPWQGGSDSETPAGGAQKMVAMPLRKLPGWLATIDPGRVKSEEARAAVVQYQNECDDVLWDYWNQGIAINPRATYAVNPGDTLTQEEAETLRLMLKSAADRQPKAKQGALMMQGWSKLKSHFKVGYREIPRHEFSEAVSIIARHTAEWEVVDDVPARKTSLDDAVRLDMAFTLASQAAAQVQRVVFNGVMASNSDWKHSRFLLDVDACSQEGCIAARAKKIESDAFVLPIGRFYAAIEDSIAVDAQTLTQLVSACTTRLGRMAQRVSISA